MMMELTLYAQAFGILLVIIGLIICVALGLRHFGLVPGAVMPLGKRRPRRLGIEEVLAVDPRRRLMLVRHDGLEHLLLLSPEGDLVVHSGPAPTVTAMPVAMSADPPSSGRY
jgi:flagellar protein FliO/FliZ